MSRESIIAKIQKLIELSDNNPSKEEAIAAALKAQKLMADYDVDQSELRTEEELEDPETVYTDFIGKTLYFSALAEVIAKNFRCKTYLLSGKINGKSAQAFYGYKTDAEAAKTIFMYLYEVSDKMANRECAKYRKLYGTGAGVYNAFGKGFVEGVEEELGKQSKALMIVTPKAVREGWNAMQNTMETKTMKCRNIKGARENGRKSAKGAIRSHRIDGQLGIE